MTKAKATTAMRAKMKLQMVQPYPSQTDLPEGTTPTQEVLTFNAVAKPDGYDADGADENNTFAKFTPQATLSITITNPELIGKFKAGESYYLDFTKAE